jgi:diguanylate cyclase (GGDEF)-like protein/PAS domain S-box-containing protein
VRALSPVVRISAGLTVVTCSIVVLLDVAGVLPRPADAALQQRIRVCETLAAQAVAAAERNDYAAIRSLLSLAVQREEEVLSAALRAPDGRLLVTSGNHQQLWIANTSARPPSTHVRVPFFMAGRPFGAIEVRFERLGAAGLLTALWEEPLMRLLLLLGLSGFFAYLIYMRRTLRYLDPSAVIPTRVQVALDMMSEGIVLADEKGRIVLANSAFAECAGRPAAKLLGLNLSSLDWKSGADEEAGDDVMPWKRALTDGKPDAGMRVVLEDGSGGTRCLLAKGAPVFDGQDRVKGVIATFDDTTELEEKSLKLENALAQLQKSQEEIRLQNDELRVLARCDPLTGVQNRRYFLEHFATIFEAAHAEGRPLCCIMVDIDHFKRINDQHGHVAGDEVIRRVSEVLQTELRATDAICRYGGEEFLLLLRDAGVERGLVVAERLRRRVAAPAFARSPRWSSARRAPRN